MSICLGRRDFIAGLGGAAAWPIAARAQQRPIPTIGFLAPVSNGSALSAALSKRLMEVGYVEGQNVKVEYRWAAVGGERRAADSGNEFAPSKANAHLALLCESALSRKNSIAQGRGLTFRTGAGQARASCAMSGHPTSRDARETMVIWTGITSVGGKS